MIRQFISAEPGKRKRDDDSQSSAASQGATSPIQPHSSSDSDSEDSTHSYDGIICEGCDARLYNGQCIDCPANDYILVINSDDVKKIVEEEAEKIEKYIETDRDDVNNFSFGPDSLGYDDNEKYKENAKLTGATYLYSIKTAAFDDFKQRLEERGLHVVELFPAESRGRNDDDDDDDEGTHSRIYEITA